MSDISQFVSLVKKSQRIAVLTGAGISTESNIPDFRSDTGIYHFTSEEVFDIDRFERDPAFFYEKIGPLCVDMLKAEPNAGHFALATWEQKLGKSVAIATQNIDGLHQRAGSRAVYEVHGTLYSLHCQDCGAKYWMKDCLGDFSQGAIAHCRDCQGVLKPDITFYGEALPEQAWLNSEQAFRQADLVLILGTSLAVYPAASLPALRSPGTPMVIINRTPTRLDREATLVFHDSIGETLAQATEEMSK